MTKMTLTRGLPGSGKTTWALKQDAVRINRDDIRFMTFGKYVLDSAGENVVTVIQHAAIESALKAGLDIVIDDTNLNTKFVSKLAKIAQKYDVEVEYKDFTDVPLEVCIDRDINRDRVVGGQVITNFYNRYIKGRKLPLPVPELSSYELKPYVERETGYRIFHNKPWAIIVDIDGTVAKMIDRGPYDWKRVGEDEPVEDILIAVRAMHEWGYQVLFTSGRDGSCRPETEQWLDKNVSYGYTLLMRAEKDNRPDWIVKAEIFDNEIRNNYNIRCVFDDRDQVVSMWRKLGLTVLQVAEGAF
jgi:predicted kinase